MPSLDAIAGSEERASFVFQEDHAEYHAATLIPSENGIGFVSGEKYMRVLRAAHHMIM
jgi:hypothetical protein